ncbi:hypothetical protein [Kiloniella sp.]|uniref:hypothetical protein n=1 Tax=Kiloniella sp. TaxID=1938587 RepID=UPI003B01E3FE
MAASMHTAKLEITYEYTCGGRVAAEFDARVSIDQEDGVLIAGEVELYGYDNDHNGAYEICCDPHLAGKIRHFILNSAPETNRAFEALSLATPSSTQTSLFGNFIEAYEECHSY